MASNWQHTFRTSLQASTFGCYVLVMNKSTEKFIQDEEDNLEIKFHAMIVLK
jgi:hypothetical protein